MGGTVAPGTYVLKSWSIYQSDYDANDYGRGANGASTLVVTFCSVALRTDTYGIFGPAATSEFWGAGSWATEGVTFAYQFDCPTARVWATQGYTATPDGLTLMIDQSIYGIDVLDYLKR
jgi:hypothetical protein